MNQPAPPDRRPETPVLDIKEGFTMSAWVNNTFVDGHLRVDNNTTTFEFAFIKPAGLPRVSSQSMVNLLDKIKQVVNTGTVKPENRPDPPAGRIMDGEDDGA